MSNRQFWSFLCLDFIYNTKFAKIFYNAISNFNDSSSKLDYFKFLDYPKFLQFVAIFTRGAFRELRIQLLFAVFDADYTMEVDRIEFRNVITCFIEMILHCRFDSSSVQEKINSLNSESSNIQLMEKVLDNYVDEVFNTFSYSGEVMSFEEWQKWLFTIQGFDRIINFTAVLKA